VIVTALRKPRGQTHFPLFVGNHGKGNSQQKPLQPNTHSEWRRMHNHQ